MQLIIDMNGFTNDKNIHVISPNGEIVQTFPLAYENVAQYTMGLLDEFEVSDIKISGIPGYVEPIEYEIKQRIAAEYADKNINIEVI